MPDVSDAQTLLVDVTSRRPRHHTHVLLLLEEGPEMELTCADSA